MDYYNRRRGQILLGVVSFFSPLNFISPLSPFLIHIHSVQFAPVMVRQVWSPGSPVYIIFKEADIISFSTGQ